MVRIRKRRLQEDGKATEFSLNKRQVPDAKIDRWVQRTGYENLISRMTMPELPEMGETPPAIDYKTPSVCNSIPGTPQSLVMSVISKPPSPEIGPDMTNLNLNGSRNLGTTIKTCPQSLPPILEHETEPFGQIRIAASEDNHVDSLFQSECRAKQLSVLSVVESLSAGNDLLAEAVQTGGRLDSKASEVILTESIRIQSSNETAADAYNFQIWDQENPLEGNRDATIVPNRPSSQSSILEAHDEPGSPQEVQHPQQTEDKDLVMISKEAFECHVAKHITRELDRPLDIEALGAHLQAAAFRGDWQTVKKIIGLSKNVVNARAPASRRTALHNAAFAGYSDIVQDLLKAGALGAGPDAHLRPYMHIDEVTPGDNLTALELAILAGKPYVVNAIISSICTKAAQVPLSLYDILYINKAAKYSMRKDRLECFETLVELMSRRSDFPWGIIILFAIEKFHFEALRVLLKSGINIDIPLPHNGTYPLERAIGLRGPLACDMFEFLLQNGLNAARKLEFGGTLLHLGAQRGEECSRYVQLLLEKGLSVDDQDTFRRTPLMLSLNDDLITQDIPEHGADRNARDKAEASPLPIVASPSRIVARTEYPNDELTICTRLLLDHGANPNLATKDRRTPLHRAAMKSNARIMMQLVQAGAALWVQDQFGCTPLHYLMRSCSILGLRREVQTLLSQAGTTLNLRDQTGRTVLHVVAANDPLHSFLSDLILFGADPNAKDWTQQTPLHIIVSSWKPTLRAVSALLNNGAISGIRDVRNRTVLHTAIFNWVHVEPEVFRVLLDRSSDLLRLKWAGDWPLALCLKQTAYSPIAIQPRIEELVSIFIEYGADVNAVDDNDRTVLSYALDGRHNQAVNDMLKAAGSRWVPNTWGEQYWSRDYFDTVRDFFTISINL